MATQQVHGRNGRVVHLREVPHVPDGQTRLVGTELNDARFPSTQRIATGRGRLETSWGVNYLVANAALSVIQEHDADIRDYAVLLDTIQDHLRQRYGTTVTCLSVSYIPQTLVHWARMRIRIPKGGHVPSDYMHEWSVGFWDIDALANRFEHRVLQDLVGEPLAMRRAELSMEGCKRAMEMHDFRLTHVKPGPGKLGVQSRQDMYCRTQALDVRGTLEIAGVLYASTKEWTRQVRVVVDRLCG